MKLGDGLFLNTCRRIAEEYKDSGIGFSDMIVDNTFVLILSVRFCAQGSFGYEQIHAIGC